MEKTGGNVRTGRGRKGGAGGAGAQCPVPPQGSLRGNRIRFHQGHLMVEKNLESWGNSGSAPF